VGERLLFLVGDKLGGVPTGASIDHVEDDVLVDKDEVAFDLRVEGVRYFNVASVGGARFGPLAANSAGLANLWYHLQHMVCYSTSLKHSPHHVVGGVPPSHVQFPQ
jgi:hypothetical protein